jgi:class 3 adenylate cyclase
MPRCVGQLETLIAEHPYRERLRAQLMLALYRSDRQADALQAYQDARRTLVEELGIQPGERLRELERAILAQDPALAAPLGRDDGDAASRGPAPHEVPTGVVTFLLTDIEGSSGLWEADPEEMAAALELHDELIARTTEAHAGRLLMTKGEGDATVTVFPRASDAVAAAVDLREALGAASWPGELELRVRIALHTGEAHERAGDYFGPALNRAARLRALAWGGATVVSQATAEIVHDRLPAEVELVDLGRRELRGLTRPENVFELRPVATHAAAPPGPVAAERAATEAAAKTPRGAFVGRERELVAETTRRADALTFVRRRGAAGRGRRNTSAPVPRSPLAGGTRHAPPPRSSRARWSACCWATPPHLQARTGGCRPLGFASDGQRGTVDLLERVIVLGRMQGDQRLAEGRGVAGIGRGVPLPVLLAEAHHHDVGLLDQRARADGVDPGPRWSFQNGRSCSPRMAVPASSEAAWSVTGAVNGRRGRLLPRRARCAHASPCGSRPRGRPTSSWLHRMHRLEERPDERSLRPGVARCGRAPVTGGMIARCALVLLPAGD